MKKSPITHLEVKSLLEKYPTLRSEIEDVFYFKSFDIKDVIYSEKMMIEWMTTPIPALSGLTPVETIQCGDLQLVLDILNRLKYGDFS